jgi:hypothetical protein
MESLLAGVVKLLNMQASCELRAAVQCAALLNSMQQEMLHSVFQACVCKLQVWMLKLSISSTQPQCDEHQLRLQIPA